MKRIWTPVAIYDVKDPSLQIPSLLGSLASLRRVGSHALLEISHALKGFVRKLDRPTLASKAS